METFTRLLQTLLDLLDFSLPGPDERYEPYVFDDNEPVPKETDNFMENGPGAPIPEAHPISVIPDQDPENPIGQMSSDTEHDNVGDTHRLGQAESLESTSIEWKKMEDQERDDIRPLDMVDTTKEKDEQDGIPEPKDDVQMTKTRDVDEHHNEPLHLTDSDDPIHQKSDYQEEDNAAISTKSDDYLQDPDEGIKIPNPQNEPIEPSHAHGLDEELTGEKTVARTQLADLKKAEGLKTSKIFLEKPENETAGSSLNTGKRMDPGATNKSTNSKRNDWWNPYADFKMPELVRPSNTYPGQNPKDTKRRRILDIFRKKKKPGPVPLSRLHPSVLARWHNLERIPGRDIPDEIQSAYMITHRRDSKDSKSRILSLFRKKKTQRIHLSRLHPIALEFWHNLRRVSEDHPITQGVVDPWKLPHKQDSNKGKKRRMLNIWKKKDEESKDEGITKIKKSFTEKLIEIVTFSNVRKVLMMKRSHSKSKE